MFSQAISENGKRSFSPSISSTAKCWAYRLKVCITVGVVIISATWTIPHSKKKRSFVCSGLLRLASMNFSIGFLQSVGASE